MQVLHAKCAVAAFKRARPPCNEAHAPKHKEPARFYGAHVSSQTEPEASNRADDRSHTDVKSSHAAHDCSNVHLGSSDGSHGRFNGEVASSNRAPDRSNREIAWSNGALDSSNCEPVCSAAADDDADGKDARSNRLVDPVTAGSCRQGWARWRSEGTVKALIYARLVLTRSFAERGAALRRAVDSKRLAIATGKRRGTKSSDG